METPDRTIRSSKTPPRLNPAQGAEVVSFDRVRGAFTGKQRVCLCGRGTEHQIKWENGETLWACDASNLIEDEGWRTMSYHTGPNTAKTRAIVARENWRNNQRQTKAHLN